MNTKKIPPWLVKRHAVGQNAGAARAVIGDLGLNTVCREANCPNASECFSKNVATFMVLGVNCTRDCRFCNVASGEPQAVDPGEPARVGAAVKRLGLAYAVITSVTRDDLPDGGAGHFADVVGEIRRQSPQTAIETLVPDFKGSESALRTVALAGPDVISHNMETVEDLYSQVRPGADYARSLRLISMIKAANPRIRSKSGVMAGLGETRRGMEKLMDDLRGAGCEFLTIGQYLAPSPNHFKVAEYVHPDVFDSYRETALKKGFAFVASAPFVRSSYNASEALPHIAP
jgi:lipoic acid synthetase